MFLIDKIILKILRPTSVTYVKCVSLFSVVYCTRHDKKYWSEKWDKIKQWIPIHRMRKIKLWKNNKSV